MRSAGLVLALALATGCGASAAQDTPGWRPSIVRDAPRDPAARDLVLAFDDGQNGTELVLVALGQARAAGATAISGFEIQVGRCVQTIASDAEPAASPEDAITFEADEGEYRCKRGVDLFVTPGEGGGSGTPQLRRTSPESTKNHIAFHDTEMREYTACNQVPVRHVVTRPRAYVEHHYVPPDWDAIAAWTKLELRAGPLRCDDRAPANVLRAHVHVGPEVAAPAPVAVPRVTPREITELVAAARAAASRGDGAAAAARAIAAWADGTALRGLDLPAARALAGSIAEARYLAVEPDVAAFLARTPADAAGVQALGAEIDRIAARYLAIGDAIRMPEAAPWLRAGAGRLAALHQHVAEILDGMGQDRAAAHQREVAVGLLAQSRP